MNDPSGPVIIADHVIIDSDPYSKHFEGTAHSRPDLQKARKRYLDYLTERYQYLELKGMGVSDRVPLRLRLQDVYVPLFARMELPRGETWERVKVGGRHVPEEDRAALGERLSEPMPVLELLEKQRGLIILGDPGAGKTTFLKWLTLQLAQTNGNNGRFPVLVPLSSYADMLSEKAKIRLDQFICNYFQQISEDIPMKDLLNQALQSGKALVMLDGLDEVRDVNLRTTVVDHVLEFYDLHKKQGNKFLLTSRIIGYRDVRPTGTDLQECTLEDFNDEQIETFIENWTAAVEKAARGEGRVASQEAERERKELMEAVEKNPGVRRLAANPLLLTILALMKRQGVRLPERRVELYNKYVETLLSSWNRARGLGRPPSRDLDVVETVRLLAPLALWMHEESPGVGLVKQAQLLDQLIQLYKKRGEENPEARSRQFLTDIREFSGLLLERGAGQYGFIHLTFEEYLAAVGIAQNAQESIQPVVHTLAKHIGDDNWREVSLLTIGYLGIVQQRDRAASAVVKELIKKRPGKPGEAAVLMGDAVYDAWPGGVTQECRDYVAKELQRVMRDSNAVEPYLRVAAGNTLARLGDPRFRDDAWFLPKDELLGFIRIPAGKFKMGSDKKTDSEAWDDELPMHELELDTYYIARWPVTVAQFRAFLKEHKPENLETYKGIENHPVAIVSWYLALKYCEWLTQKLRDWPGLPAELAELIREKGWIV
ncbi:MAG: NACHT domain-containing protein, partial [Calditrichaeota bacterium]